MKYLNKPQKPAPHFPISSKSVSCTKPNHTTPMNEHHLPQLGLAETYRLLHIPGGSFWLGSLAQEADADQSEQPAHEIQISDFYLGEYLLTQEYWQALMGDNPARFKDERRPVENVSWYDAAVFCNRLSLEAGLRPCYQELSKSLFGQGKKIFGQTKDGAWDLPNQGRPQLDPSANGYRLPSEAEREYAARGGAYTAAARLAYAGSENLDQCGWYDENSQNETSEVGLLLPNALGLYDLSGNVWEWCGDWYNGYPKERKKDPLGPDEGRARVLRGGSCFGGLRGCRAAYRYDSEPGYRNNNVGFRLARSLQ
jgi:formylglycine-generating enzyme